MAASEGAAPEAAEREYERLCRDKARAELARADAAAQGADRVRSWGDELAEVLLVKGEPGRADLEAGRALAGPDGEAIGKALDALGMPKQRFAVCSRPAALSEEVRGHRLALTIEAVDPKVVVALDAAAAADVASAYRVDVPAPGVPVRVRGRVVLAVSDFEAALADERLKRKAWRQLRGLTAVRVAGVAGNASGRP